MCWGLLFLLCGEFVSFGLNGTFGCFGLCVIVIGLLCLGLCLVLVWGLFSCGVCCLF